MLRVFGYLKGYLKYGITIDTSERELNQTQEVIVNWEEQYPGAREEIPSDMPTTKGRGVQLSSICGRLSCT